MASYHIPRNGFTLIELSIVLVIIGLLVGGILTGRDLIKSAELNSIITQKTKYDIASNTFRGKYTSIPGDSANAVQFFGASGGNAGDNFTSSCMNFVALDNTHTCNGSGDGSIGPGGPQVIDMVDLEGLLFWHHLSLAGLIDTGGLTPRNSAGSPWELPGFNIPRSKVSSNSGFSMFKLCAPASAAFFANNICSHSFFYGAQDPTPDNNYLGLAMYPSLSALEAQNIDKKIDDGLPATGSVTTLPPGGQFLDTCASTSSVSTAVYTVTTGGITCALMFKASF